MASATQADLSRYRTRRDYTMYSNFSFKPLMTGGLAALAHQHPADEAGGRGQRLTRAKIPLPAPLRRTPALWHGSAN